MAEEAKSNTQTSKSVQNNSSTSLDNDLKQMNDTFKKQKKVSVTIPKFLQRRLGKNHPVAVNGSVIYVPVDGQKHNIPESHAAVLNDMINNIKSV